MKRFGRPLVLFICIICISMLHYLTPLEMSHLHDIYQRFYYLPIIMSAFWYGLRGGLACSFLISLLYAPHIIFQWGAHHLPVGMEKYLEVILYNIVAGVTGFLVQKEQKKSAELQKTAKGLDESYKKLQAQSERMIAIEEKLRLAEKLSLIGEMSAMLAHEIRNPLGGIRGSAEILMDDFSPEHPKYEFFEMQLQEINRLDNVVMDFLRMARQQPNEIISCSLQEELETVAMLVASEAKKRGVRVVLQPFKNPLTINVDGEKLRQAFLNIIINALQATAANGRVTISVELLRAEFCEISFSDTGSGIDSATLKRMFEPFFTTKNDGTGLGMSITKKIIESHSGLLLVKSKVGKGTTVTVQLPMHGKPNGENFEIKNSFN